MNILFCKEQGAWRVCLKDESGVKIVLSKEEYAAPDQAYFSAIKEIDSILSKLNDQFKNIKELGASGDAR